MPDYRYPDHFQAVASANQSGWYDAKSVEWHTAYGFYQDSPTAPKTDEGAHVFRREPLAVASTEVALLEPRIPNRATLWPSPAGGLELRGIRSANVRAVIPVPGVTAPVLGTKGPKGDSGTNGHSILSGTDSPTPLDGNIGDFWLDIPNMKLYGPKAAAPTVWGVGVSLVGPPGPGGTGTGGLSDDDKKFFAKLRKFFSALTD